MLTLRAEWRSSVLSTVIGLALACNANAGDEASDTDTSGTTQGNGDGSSSTSETDQTGTGATNETDTNGTTGTGTGSTNGTDSGDSGTGECPTFAFDDENSFLCSVPVDCGSERCSATPTEAPFDEQGCMRQRCDGESDCEDDEVCFIAAACDPDTCFPWGITCADEQGPGNTTECTCESFGCADYYIGWCIPETDRPTDCDQRVFLLP